MTLLSLCFVVGGSTFWEIKRKKKGKEKKEVVERQLVTLGSCPYAGCFTTFALMNLNVKLRL
jgi:hypothetical protein